MNKKIYIAMLLLTLIVAVCGIALSKRHVAISVTPVNAPSIPATPPAIIDNKILNLALPENTFLMDRAITLPENQHKLANLFKKEDQEQNVKIGGKLILDDKPPEPNAAVWDAVKGAEVGITIKTP